MNQPMRRPIRYVVNEHFFAFQGEGIHTGRAAYFIRLHGCDQQCPWCDAAGTWHPAFKRSDYFTGDAIDVADLVTAPDGAIVVITGGEPCLYDLDPLVDQLRFGRGFDVHIETAGHRPLPENADWITLSPKPRGVLPLPENLPRANEFKLIVEDIWSLNASLMAIRFAERSADQTVWLHPEWSQRENPRVLNLISAMVKENPRFRAGWQMHKLYMVDLLDANADRRVIPLGGEAKNGTPY